MSAANKKRGALFETDLMKYLRNEGHDVERLRLSGREDEGDLILKIGGRPFILEAKNEQRINLAGYIREAAAEARNFFLHREPALKKVPNYAAVVKKRNAGIGEAYVVVPLHEWLDHIEVD